MNAIRTLKFFILTTAIAVFTVSTAQAKRYFVIYKSQQGYKMMDDYMKLESSSKAFGVTKSLKNIHAMIINIENGAVVDQLKNHPEIDSVVEETFLPPPQPVNGFHMARSSSAPIIQPLNANANPDSFIQTDGTPWGIIAVRAPGAWGLSEAGARARVLVLDTGIDKNHVALNNNIEKAKNFVSQPADGSKYDENKTQDDVGHGTHVSGTIGGQYNDQTGFVGVAPKVKILMGKVCQPQVCTDMNDPTTCKGGCSLFDIAAGIDWGIEQKVDVISMSLGGPGKEKCSLSAGIKAYAKCKATNYLVDQVSKPMVTSLANAEAAGIFTVAASGNSATEATATTPAMNPAIGYPAAVETVLSVGALDSKLTKTSFSQWGPTLDITAPGAGVISSVPMQTGRDSLVYLTIDGQKVKVPSVSFGGTKEIMVAKIGVLVPAGLGKPDDFKNANYAGKFALISRGEIPFAEKVKNAQAAGALGVVIYNNTDGLAQGTISPDGKTEIDYAVVMIEKVMGENLVAAINAGKVATTEVSTIKTDYAMFDGTSMATPHVAGVAALAISAYKIAHGGKTLTPAKLRALLQRTAFPLGPNTDNKYGAGIVQATGAVVEAAK